LRQIYRYEHGHTPVPNVVIRLMTMFVKHGVPAEF